MSNLIKKIENRTATVGILGLGYVGIPLAFRICEVGYKVIGFDVLENRVSELNNGKSPIKHITSDQIQLMIAAGFKASADFSLVSECDALIICVPTPLNAMQEPDLSFILSTMDAIAPHLRGDQLLSLESTTWPGTTREVLLPRIEQCGFKVGEDYFLVYSPEREDPGNKIFNTKTIPKVIGGLSPACLEAGARLYGKFIDKVIEVSSTEAAEMVKLLENIHRSINIGLANEMKIVADAMGLDIFEIIDAAKTKPFGFTAYYPGPGIGGHCIPIDPFYLTWKAREFGLHTRFIELAGEINKSMPEYVVNKAVKALNRVGKTLKNAKILALGIAYKRDVDDVRESPSVFVIELLRDWGADVYYSDPMVPNFPEMREHKFDLSSVKLTPDSIASFDAIILLTDHSDFDYTMIVENAKMLIDTRGKFRGNASVIRA